MNKVRAFQSLMAIIVLSLAFTGYATEPGKGAAIDTVQILKISPHDQRAVIKTTNGKMQVIKVGDAVGESGRVVEITEGRVVIEEKVNDSSERVIIRLENGSQKVERFKKAESRQPALYMPQPAQKMPAVAPSKDKGAKEKKQNSFN